MNLKENNGLKGEGCVEKRRMDWKEKDGLEGERSVVRRRMDWKKKGGGATHLNWCRIQNKINDCTLKDLSIPTSFSI